LDKFLEQKALSLIPEKTKAINQMPIPQTREELLTLLGMLNYLGKYIPNFTTENKTPT
jgi:uncharacterized protein YvpB